MFTDSKDESYAIKSLDEIDKDSKGAAKQFLKNVLGIKNINKIRKIIR